MAAASTLAVVERVGAGERRGRTRARPWPRPSPAPCAARRPRRSGAIDTRLTSPPPAVVDELQRHLDAVAVGLVEDQLAVTLQRVGRRDRARPGRAGSGICLTQTITFMAGHCYRASSGSDQQSDAAAHRSHRGSTWYRRALAHPARRELVRVVGDGAQHGRRAPPPGRATTSSSSRPTAAATPPASPTTPPAAASTSSIGVRRRRHAERGGHRARRHRRPRSGCSRRLDERVRPHDRAAQRSGRRRRAAGRRHRRRRHPPDRARPGQRPVLLLPHRRRLRRRGRARGRAARVAEALARPSAVHHGGADARGLAATTAAPRTSGSSTPSGGRSTTATSRSCSTPTRTRTSATARSTCRRAATFDRGLVGDHVPDDEGPRDPRRARRRAARRRREADAGASTSRSTSTHLVIEHDDAVPVPARRRLPRRDRRLEFDHVPDAVDARAPEPATVPESARVAIGRDADARCRRRRRQGASRGRRGSRRARWCRCRRRPSRRARATRAGSSHVQVLTAMPASWQRSISVGVDASAPTDAARRGRGRDHVVDVVGAPTATSATPCGIVRRERPAAVDGLEPERRDQPAAPARPRSARRGQHLVGDAIGRVEVGFGRVVLDLDVDPHARRTRRAPRRASARAPAGRPGCVATITRPSARRASWWTTSAPSAVRRTSSSTPSAPMRPRRARTPRRCSPRSARDAPRWAMTLGHRRHGYPLSSAQSVVLDFTSTAPREQPSARRHGRCTRHVPSSTTTRPRRRRTSVSILASSLTLGAADYTLARRRAVSRHRSRAVLPGRHDGHGARADRAGQAGVRRVRRAARSASTSPSTPTRTPASGAGCPRRSAASSAASGPPPAAAASRSADAVRSAARASSVGAHRARSAERRRAQLRPPVPRARRSVPRSASTARTRASTTPSARRGRRVAS